MKTHCLLAAFGALVLVSPMLVWASGPTQLPFTFIENQGQWDGATLFAAGRGDASLRVERDALVLGLPRGPDGTEPRGDLRFVFEGAASGATVVGEDPSRAVTNFLVGNDPAQWRRGVPAYRQVVYRDLYPGIEVRVREADGRLKYDVRVAPGADLSQVVIRCEGARGLGLGADGSLDVKTAAGMLRQPVPLTWQELPWGGRMTVECRYRLLAGDRYGFTVAGRDPELPLVIDPEVEPAELEWATYFGSPGTDVACTVAVGGNGEVIAAGYTDDGVPTTESAYDPTFNGTWDGWIACFDPSQIGEEQLMWCTYLGGGGDDRIFHLAVDATSVWVVGLTGSGDFPTTEGAYDESYNGAVDVFVTRLNDDGSAIISSTLLGSQFNDWGIKVDVSAPSGPTVSGYTNSPDFPTTEGAYDQTWNGNYDLFVTRFSSDLGSLVFSTFLGGSGGEAFTNDAERQLGGLAVDESGAVIVSGLTASGDFPTTPGAYRTTIWGTSDAFLSRLSPDGDSLEFSTYFGGTADDLGTDLALRPGGEIVLGGITWSSNLPTTEGAFDTSFNGADDAFIAIFDNTLGALHYGTYLGGSGYDVPTDVEITDDVGGPGDVILAGACNAYGSGFPVTPDAYDPTEGAQDAFFLRLRPLDTGASDLLYSTFLGGSSYDVVWSVALPPGGYVLDAVVLAGSTRGYGFPVTPDAYDTTHNSEDPSFPDAFVACMASIGPTDVDDPDVAGTTPGVSRLGLPHPNPSAGRVAFTIDLPAQSRVQVGVFDVNGRLVTELLNREVASGRHELSWEPDALRGQVMPGVYFIRLEADGEEESRKVVISR